jgi:hypothetical protein
MNLSDLAAQLEADLLWRQDEVRFFQNRGATLPSEDEKDQYRRAVILVLYAHFEGFCKFGFEVYRTTINSEQISCADATPAIAAAGWAQIFKELRDPTKKCRDFKNTLPDDGKLHRFARDREFMERKSEFAQLPVMIPEEFIDTESNLKPVVLRKILYRLGLPYDQFEQHEGQISRLLNTRNKIAHGEDRAGVKETEYEELRKLVFQMMDAIKNRIIEYLRHKAFLRPLPPVPVSTATS